MIKLILSAVFLLISSISLSRKISVHNSKEENFKKSVQYLTSEQLAGKETVLLFSKNKKNSIARFVVFTDYRTADTYLLTSDYRKLTFLKE
mgnify:CR=1 FL=1